MVSIKQRGSLTKTRSFLNHAKSRAPYEIMRKYGELGVSRLASMTPRDTSETAASWFYKIKITDASAKITFHNDKVIDGVNIAIILQYGHGTRQGGWVEGRDYINPALRPVFDMMARDVWREVVSG